ncbi:hypothetical protein TWF730_011169 [Orbilia blumenaviensis]|uniref:Uncharacterized protein n=1 Tax=Orbilia blumenaviensis TaxID=1796055 RepID=A0AAV9UKD0_9PEZI
MMNYPVCDHPDYGRSIFIANPYARTTDKRAWSFIPCQVCDLRARYWFEDKRQRDVRPLADRIHNLQARDFEDPLNIRNNYYSTTHRKIPRRVTFVDEDGELELPWTTEELAARTESERRGVEYIRPYILLRRAAERGETTMDTFTNLDAPLAAGYAGGQGQEQHNPSASDAIFEQLIGTVDELDDTNRPHMRQVPIESGDRNSGGGGALNQDVQRQALDSALNLVLRTGNMVSLMALVRADASLGLGDIDAEVIRGLGIHGDGDDIGRMDRISRQGERQSRVQGILQEDEADSEEVLGNINSDSAAGEGSPSGSLGGSGENSNIPLGRPQTKGGYCGRFLGRLCNSISSGVSGLLGWSQGPSGPSVEYIRPEEPDFREPVELDTLGT